MGHFHRIHTNYMNGNFVLGCPYNYFMHALAYYLASLWINNVEERAPTGEKNKLILIRLLELKQQHIPQMHNARPMVKYHGRILGPCKAKLCFFFCVWYCTGTELHECLIPLCPVSNLVPNIYWRLVICVQIRFRSCCLGNFFILLVAFEVISCFFKIIEIF